MTDDRPVQKKTYLAGILAKLGRGLKQEGRDPQGTGPPNRHGMPTLPVGQHTVSHWPRLDLGVIPAVDRSTFTLTLDGLVERPATLDWAAFMALPQVEDTSDFHCVTTWSRLDNRWGGVRFSTLADLVRPRPEARFVLCEGSDRTSSGEPYTTNLSLERALDPDVLLVHTWEGAPLPREHGGPVRMVTPRLYAWKGAKWITRITFLADDHPGFWEVRGYSNTADPWQDDRHG